VTFGTLQKTNIDWFSFRTKDGPESIHAALKTVIPSRYDLTIGQRSSGWRSFEKSYDLWLTDQNSPDPEDGLRIGTMASGGAAVKGWTMATVTGTGCAFIEDWGKTMDVCTDRLEGFDLKRVDVALDRFDGSHWHEVDAAWSAGEFCPPGGGKKPKAKPIDSRRPEDGRTYYVGSRESAKFYRGYEKGMQVLGPQITAAQNRDPEAFDILDWIFKEDMRIDRTGADGAAKVQLFALRDWWRDEVEFKPVNQPLPLDLVENRDQYFAGSYPYLAKVLPSVEAQPLITRRERMPQLELAKMLEQVCMQYGNTLFTAMHAYEGDISAVFSKIVGKKHNKELVAAGVLLVDHE
jgi:phage replication initiation protein